MALDDQAVAGECRGHYDMPPGTRLDYTVTTVSPFDHVKGIIALEQTMRIPAKLNARSGHRERDSRQAEHSSERSDEGQSVSVLSFRS